MSDDYSAFTIDETLDAGKLASLSNLVDHQLDEEMEVARLEGLLKDTQERLRDVAERQIPDLMDEIGLDTITTSAGLKVSVKTTLRASVPVAQRDTAWDWLDAHGHGGMIKRSVQVAFNRDQESAADELVDGLRSKFPNVKTERKVEPSTLKAFIREQLEEGNEVPMELFGAFEQRRAKIEEAKKA